MLHPRAVTFYTFYTSSIHRMTSLLVSCSSSFIEAPLFNSSTPRQLCLFSNSAIHLFIFRLWVEARQQIGLSPKLKGGRCSVNGVTCSDGWMTEWLTDWLTVCQQTLASCQVNNMTKREPFHSVYPWYEVVGWIDAPIDFEYRLLLGGWLLTGCAWLSPVYDKANYFNVDATWRQLAMEISGLQLHPSHSNILSGPH